MNDLKGLRLRGGHLESDDQEGTCDHGGDGAELEESLRQKMEEMQRLVKQQQEQMVDFFDKQEEYEEFFVGPLQRQEEALERRGEMERWAGMQRERFVGGGGWDWDFRGRARRIRKRGLERRSKWGGRGID